LAAGAEPSRIVETAMERYAEIDQIKQELELLRARYERYRQFTRILKGFFMFVTLLHAK
jgi:hypothetical protein